MKNSKSREQLTVYHYCSLEIFLAIINNSTIRMGNISKSNDFKEITYCVDAFKSALSQACIKYKKEYGDCIYQEFYSHLDIDEVVNNAVGNESLTYYATCFSEEPDLLGQWRGYAGNATGVAIGLNPKLFYKISDRQNFKFGRIYYNIDLCFEAIKNELITEIYIGPKSGIDDVDLRLLLTSKGYDISTIKIINSSATFR